LHGPERRADQPVLRATNDRDAAAMKAAVVLIAVVVLSASRPAGLWAQTEGSILTLLPGTTRAAGLAGAGAALVGDAGAIFSNPAGLATIRHLSVEGSYEPYLAGSAVTTAAHPGRADTQLYRPAGDLPAAHHTRRSVDA